MKKLLVFLIFCLLGCKSKNIVSGLYVLNKRANSYNVILKLDNNKYTLSTISTGLSGTTNGVLRLSKNHLILIPEDRIFDKVNVNDSIYLIEKYLPFRDTLCFKIKRNKLIPGNKKNTLTLFRVN